MKIKAFLSQLDHDRIVAAIGQAESRSRAEIRVHVSSQKVEDAQQAAARQFESLGMTATAERNGVLIYVAPGSKAFAVVGDQGIHERCGQSFWNDVAAAMEAEFRQGHFTEGIVHGVARAGEALAVHFPRTDKADVNELSNEVSED